MSRRQTMIAAVVATPGIHMQEIAARLGLTTRPQLKSLATQLSQLCQAKKLRKDGILNGSISRPRYWPTPTSLIDGRTLHWADHNARKRLLAKPPTPKPAARETQAQKRARYASAQATVPKAKSQMRIVDPPRPKPSATVRNAQTVEDFRRRGGKIEYLPRHASSNPLLFDHGTPDVPVANRRPSFRHRAAPGR